MSKITLGRLVISSFILFLSIFFLASCGGGGNGDVAPVKTAPVVSGYARYLDINNNGINDANDQLIIPFDQDIRTNTVVSSDFILPVTGDTFGEGATVAPGPAANEVTITLGTSPEFKTAEDFSGAMTGANSASGVDVAALMGAEAIEGVSGIDAVQSTPIDLIPAFVDSQQRLGANSSLSVVLGDLDNDGDLDMVVANDAGQGNRVYFNDFDNSGKGVFTDSGQSLGTNDSRSVALGDINGDTYLDIVVANFGQGNQIYTNDGNGRFNAFVGLPLTDADGLPLTKASTCIAMGDVDGDEGSDLDIVVANFGQKNRLYMNDGNGSGVFIETVQQPFGFNFAVSVTLGDVDGNGDLDMVVANTSNKGVLIYLNNVNNSGKGIFTDSGQVLGASESSQSVALGDVDGDGDLDLVVANNSQGNRVYLNNYMNSGKGVFTDSAQSLGRNDSIFVVLGDVDGDNDLDMVVANNNQSSRVYSNNGSGIFTDTGQSLSEKDNDNASLALGDIDNDGDLDMVVASYGHGNMVYLNSLNP